MGYETTISNLQIERKNRTKKIEANNLKAKPKRNTKSLPKDVKKKTISELDWHTMAMKDLEQKYHSNGG